MYKRTIQRFKAHLSSPVAQSVKVQTRVVFIFPPLLILLLALDSQYFADHYFDGRIFANVILPVWVSLLFCYADASLRRVILVMLPLSYLGELISSPWLELYFYRGYQIPFYIPFGHSAVFASCMMLANLPKVAEKSHLIIHLVRPILIVAILAAGFFLNDHFSLFFGLLLVLILQFKGWSHFYMLMAIIVFVIEVVGTSFSCWTWQPENPYLFRTVNPPVGAIYIYVIGDIVVQWFAGQFSGRKSVKSKTQTALDQRQNK